MIEEARASFEGDDQVARDGFPLGASSMVMLTAAERLDICERAMCWSRECLPLVWMPPGKIETRLGGPCH